MMPIRFWKSFLLDKGSRLDTLRRELSSPRNIGLVTFTRSNADIPSSGIKAYTQAGRKQKPVSVQMWIGLIVGFVGIMCCIFLGFFWLLTSSTDNLNTPTPALTNTESSPAILATATSTNAPSLIPASSVTPLPLSTLAPTWTPEPTFTPFVLSTLPVVTSPSTSVCSCSSDQYNCSDFASQSAAQACFNACIAAGKGDIHRLDENNNGIACESN